MDASKAEAVRINERLNKGGELNCTKADIDFVKRMFYPHIGALSKGRVHCMDCGEEFLFSKQKCNCPKCGVRLNVEKSRKRVWREKLHYQRTEKIGKFQVVRSYVGYGGTGVTPQMQEFQRYMIDEAGNEYVFSKRKAPYHYLHGGYVMDSPISLARTDSCVSLYRWRAKSVQPWLAKRGFDKSDKEFGCVSLVYYLTKYPQIEGVYKSAGAKAAGLLSDHLSDREWLYPAIKIANRHGATCFADDKALRLWYDMLVALKKLGKDVRNPKFLVPENLCESHDHWCAVLERAEEKRRQRLMLEAQRRQAEYKAEARKRFERRIKFFADLCFDINGLTVKPITTVGEMIDEGKNMHNCVGTYWERDNSLVLHGLDASGKSVATIEVKLDTLTVPQCYAVCNSESPYRESVERELTNNYRIKLRYLRYQRELRKAA